MYMKNIEITFSSHIFFFVMDDANEDDNNMLRWMVNIRQIGGAQRHNVKYKNIFVVDFFQNFEILEMFPETERTQ